MLHHFVATKLHFGCLSYINLFRTIIYECWFVCMPTRISSFLDDDYQAGLLCLRVIYVDDRGLIHM